MEDLIFKALGTLSIPGVIGLVAYLCYKAGLFNALASYVRKDTQDERLDGLFEFKNTAENNHFTDLDSLLEWRKITEAWRLKTDERLNQIAEDVAYLRGKVGNGYRQ